VRGSPMNQRWWTRLLPSSLFIATIHPRKGLESPAELFAPQRCRFFICSAAAGIPALKLFDALRFNKGLNTVRPNNKKIKLMKNFILSAVIALALTASVRAADVSTKLSDVHLCCQSCVKGAQKAVADIKGLDIAVDKDAGTVTLTGPDAATVQKGADALVAAGYFGKSSDPSIKVASDTGAKGKKVQSLKLEDVHLCCGKCVSAVDKAVKSVPGVKEHTAAKNAKSFEVTGDFNDEQVVTALQKAGLTGKVAE
jgi:copper chaperone CopZ